MNIIANIEVVKKRLSECTACEFKSFVLLLPVCNKCKCPIAMKAKLESSKCPIGKW
jgi:hypothetical protein